MPRKSQPEPSQPEPSQPEPGSSILDDLRAIDTSLLDKLIELRTAEVRLADYLAKAASLKENVKGKVWQRVVGDYERRIKGYEAEAAPLKVQAFREYQKLQMLLGRIQSKTEEACLAKEELEFRGAVGELGQEDLMLKLEEPQRTLDACQRDLATVEAQKARFVEAFGSEAQLVDVPTATPTPPVAPPPVDAPPPKTVVDTTRGVEDESPDATIQASMTEEESPSLTSSTVGPTFVLQRAAVFITFGNSEPKEHRLAAINYLGRMEDNQIQIARPGVSRRHALIEGRANGFHLKDLGSQNGTFLNGERVTERVLTDGDRIVIGDTQILFRLPWPQPEAAGKSAS